MKKSAELKRQSCNKKRERPTLLEFLAGFYQEAQEQFGVPLEIAPTVRPAPLPGWGKETVSMLGKTIFKPLLKLRPSPEKVNIQNFGKTIGVVCRGITFFRIDVHKIREAEGLNKISPELLEEIQPSDQTRAFLLKKLGRPVAQTERLEDLEKELVEKQIKQWEEVRDRAFLLIGQRSAKEYSLFLKGLKQGYSIFVDVEGQFCSDRGRAKIHIELLSSMHEIEKMRRMFPPKKDADLHELLKSGFRFPGSTKEDSIAWLRNVCDDISLYMSAKSGRPYGVSC